MKECDPSSAWAHRTSNGITISVVVTPRAKKNVLGPVHGGALKIKLAAPPIEGRANEALVAYLSEYLSIPQRDIAILRGDKNRNKVVSIRGNGEALLCRLLAGLSCP